MHLSCNIDAPDGQVVGVFAFQRRVRPVGDMLWSDWEDVRFCDTGTLVGRLSEPNETMTPFYHMSSDIRSVAEERQYRFMLRRHLGAEARRIRLCRIYGGVEQLKR